MLLIAMFCERHSHMAPYILPLCAKIGEENSCSTQPPRSEAPRDHKDTHVKLKVIDNDSEMNWLT